MDTLWDPIDFIVAGDFADHKTIKFRLHEVRGIYKATCAILLVRQGEQFYQNLCYVDHEHRTHAPILEQKLVAPHFDTARAKLLFACDYPYRDGTLGELLDKLRYGTFLSPLFDEFDETVPAVIHVVRPRFRALTAEDEPVLSTQRPNGRSHNPTSIGADCATLVLSPVCKPTARNLDSKLRNLSICVNASADVVISRQMALLQRATARFDSEERQIELDISTSSQSLENNELMLKPEHFRRLRDVTVNLTNASRGGIYHTGRRRGELLRVDKTDETSPHHSRDAFATPSVIKASYEMSRPILFNDRDEFLRMNPGTEYLASSNENINPVLAQLTIPVLFRNFGMVSNAPVGVINVENVTGRSSRPFSMHDFLLIREAAARIALFESRLWNIRAIQSLLTLNERNNTFLQSLPTSDINDDSLSSLRRQTSGDSSPGQPLLTVPTDYLRAKLAIESALEQAYHLIGNIAGCAIAGCTVRVFSCTRRDLTLLAAYPSILQQSNLTAVDPRDDTSGIARAARLETIQHWAPASPDAYKVGPIHSFLSIPLFLNGRVSGVLTLASAHSNAFAETSWTARSFAQLLSLCLAVPQYQIEHTVTALTARLSLAFHELNKIPSRLARRIDELDRQWRSVIASASRVTNDTDIKETLNQIAADATLLDNSLALFDQVQRPNYGTAPIQDDLKAIVDRLLMDEELSSWFVVDAVPDRLTLVPGAGGNVLPALRHLLQNARPNIQRLGIPGRITVTYESRGQRLFGVVTIDNPVIVRIPPIRLQQLFREPLISKTRIRYGAYLAAALIRYIGGEVYIANNEAQGVSIKLEVPLFSSRPAAHQ